MQIAEPRLPDDLEGNADDGDDRCWHADALRALAEQLSVTNDFYFPLLSAATLLDGRTLSAIKAAKRRVHFEEVRGILKDAN